MSRVEPKPKPEQNYYGAVIDVDEFVEAASTPEFAALTQRADARVRDLGFVRYGDYPTANP